MRDNLLKKRAEEHLTAEPLWSGDFIRPVKGEAAESFGSGRALNEEMSSTHRGTDFEVKEGTPVLVSNSGTVVLANELYYEGKCVIVNHGEKFFTVYMHLSTIDVRLGQKTKERSADLSFGRYRPSQRSAFSHGGALERRVSRSPPASGAHASQE